MFPSCTRAIVAVALVLSSFLTWSQETEARLILVKQNSAPKYFAENSNRLGLCDQVYNAIAEHLANSGQLAYIDSMQYPIKRILSMLEQGKAHVFCGAGRNASREKKFLYSRLPVYSVSNVVIAHQEELFIPESIADLRFENAVVGAYYGTSSAKFLRQHDGVRVMDNITTLESALSRVAEKQVRFFYYHDLGLSYLVRESSLPIKLIPTKFRTVPQWLLYSRHLNESQIQLIDAALRDITENGVLDSINRQYLPY